MALACVVAGVAPAGAQTLVERSGEARFQLDLHVNEAALAAYLPPGWSSDVATQGPAKDCNLRVIFVDRITINGPDGRPLRNGSNRLVYLAAPVKDPGGARVQFVLGGITEDPADAPGPFGNYLPATTHAVHRSTASVGTGATIDAQDWLFEAAGGERLELRITFEKGVGVLRAPAETRFYSATNPGYYQISRQEQVLDILRNVTTSPPDRVREFSFKASGGRYARLFDGTQRVLSWDNVLWLTRAVLVP